MRSRRLYDPSRDAEERAGLAASEPDLLARMQQPIDDLFTESRNISYTLHQGAPVEVDDETRQQLEALGYLTDR